MPATSKVRRGSRPLRGCATGPGARLPPADFTHHECPPRAPRLAAGVGESDETLPDGSTHLANDASLHRYLGAAPPPGDPPHRYFLVASALDVADAAEAGVPHGATPALASYQTLAHTIARAMLVPVYGA